MTACAAAYRATCGHRRKIQQNSKNFGPYQGRSDGGYWGGGVVNPPTFLKLTYSEIWVGHSENKGDNRLDSTNEIYLLNRNY